MDGDSRGAVNFCRPPSVGLHGGVGRGKNGTARGQDLIDVEELVLACIRVSTPVSPSLRAPLRTQDTSRLIRCLTPSSCVELEWVVRRGSKANLVRHYAHVVVQESVAAHPGEPELGIGEAQVALPVTACAEEHVPCTQRARADHRESAIDAQALHVPPRERTGRSEGGKP